jgi:hypothetical protein
VFAICLSGRVEKGGDSSGRPFHGVVDLVQFTYFTSLVLEASEQIKNSIWLWGAGP